MTTPAFNPRRLQSVRRTFYNMSRRYGQGAYIYRTTEAEVDRDTGERTVETERQFIRFCVQINDTQMRAVLYTPAMMQAIRNTAWQGAGVDTSSVVFLIYGPDTRNWGDITTTDYVWYDEDAYQVSEALKLNGGWILQAKLAEGSGPEEIGDF